MSEGFIIADTDRDGNVTEIRYSDFFKTLPQKEQDGIINYILGDCFPEKPFGRPRAGETH